MPRRIEIEIERDGEVVPVTDIVNAPDPCNPSDPTPVETGIVLHGETSASPRGLGIHIRPLSARTKVEFGRVQETKGWVRPRTFRLNLVRRGNKLSLEGVDSNSLPPGKYELKLRIGGMKVKPSFPVLTVPKSGGVKLRLREKIHRRLRLNRPVRDFDRGLLRILQHPESLLDGVGAADWLSRAKHADRRKAVLLNVLAKLGAIERGSKTGPLSAHVDHVFFAEIDRVYCAVSRDFHEIVKAKFQEDAFISRTHKRLLHRIPGKCPDDFELISYREPRRTASLQAVIAVPKSSAHDPHYVDLDIDGANPGMDLVTFFMHFGEILNPDATDHLRLVKKLDRSQVGDFSYYDVEKV